MSGNFIGNLIGNFVENFVENFVGKFGNFARNSPRDYISQLRAVLEGRLGLAAR